MDNRVSFPHYLFVYGTLRREAQFPLEKYLGKWVIFIGRGTCQGILIDLGSYPGVIPSHRKTDRVVGELYRLLEPENVLARLDYYEGFRPNHPQQSEYIRRQIPVRLEDGSTLDAWIYFYNGQTTELRVIRSGDYLQYLNDRKTGSL